MQNRPLLVNIVIAWISGSCWSAVRTRQEDVLGFGKMDFSWKRPWQVSKPRLSQFYYIVHNYSSTTKFNYRVSFQLKIKLELFEEMSGILHCSILIPSIYSLPDNLYRVSAHCTRLHNRLLTIIIAKPHACIYIINYECFIYGRTV